jgi:hypothetical protein
MCNDVICLFRFSAVTLNFGNHKNIIWYELFFIFGRWGMGLTTLSLLFSFSTLFFSHNLRHYVIFQLQINYLTGLPFVLPHSDPCNFERLSKINSCVFFPYYNCSNTAICIQAQTANIFARLLTFETGRLLLETEIFHCSCDVLQCKA